MSLRGLAWIAVVPWALLFGVPIFFVIKQGWSVSGPLDPLVLSKVAFTVKQAAWSAFIAGVLGLPVGWSLRHRPELGVWLRLPFGVPTLVAVAAWTSLLRGTQWAYSLQAVILAHVVFNVPWVALMVQQASASIPRSLEESASTLGAGLWSRLRLVAWPVVGPAWWSAIAQVFSLCSASFAIVLILGGGPPVESLETAIYASVRTGSLDLKSACSLALWQMLLSSIPWFLVRKKWGTQNRTLISLRQEGIRFQAGGQSILGWVIAVVWVLPYFAFLRELRLEALGPEFWVSVRWPLFVSVGLAASTALLVLAWSGAAVVFLRGRARWIETLALLPSGVSVLTLSFGFWIAYASWIDPFEGSLIALVLIQAAVFFPLVLKVLLPVSNGMSTQQWELARTLGASRWEAFWSVEWPRWRLPVWNSLALVCSASLGEVAAVSFFGSEKVFPASALLSRWMALYRFDEAYWLAAILLLLSLVLSLGLGTARAQQRDFFGR